VDASERIRIRKVPPTALLEGIDLRPYAFQEGDVQLVERRLALTLIVWGYADPDVSPAEENDVERT
jgi:hypothetical protein